jgi:GT2 family glycosyltransferase
MPPLVSIVIVGYNSASYLDDCIQSIERQRYPNYEIILVDNASTDNTVHMICEQFPSVRVFALDRNLGFGGGNNFGAAQARGDFLAFLNPDTQVDPDWLSPLIAALQSADRVGIVTSKLLLTQQPDTINALGNFVHFTGFGYLRGWMQHRDTFDQSDEVFAISGAAFAISRELWQSINGFDELFYPAYVEDIDLSWRVHLAGYRCLCIADSVVYHDYKATFNTHKYTMLEKHRQQMLFKNLRWGTLVVLAPALLLAEIVTWGYALLSGLSHIKAKFQSYGWFFSRWQRVRQAHRATQEIRQTTDRAILKQCTYRLNYGQAGTGIAVTVGEKVLDPIFYVLYHISLFFIRW